MNSVSYNSGLIIWDPAYLTTLCVFYDQVLLPASGRVAASGAHSSDSLLAFSRPVSSAQQYVCEDVSHVVRGPAGTPLQKGNPKLVQFARLVPEWDDKNRVLFDHHVLRRLEPEPSPSLALGSDVQWQQVTPHLLDLDFALRSKWQNEGEETESILIWEDLARHLLRADVRPPRIFVGSPGEHNRGALNTLLAHSAFSLLLPKLSGLQPDQIMDVRNKVKCNREGFSMHLQALSADVEARIEDGDSLSEVARYAQSVAETKLLPFYAEWKRQLAAERAGFWGQVLDTTSAALKIDVGPWTPKFYGELLKALGFVTLKGIAEHKGRLTNESQAYQFMRAIEDREII